MRIPDNLLNKYSGDLSFKRFFKKDTNGTTYGVYQEGDFKGVVSFRDHDYGIIKDSNINVLGLFLDTVKNGLATKILDIACKCGEELNAKELTIIYPFEEKIIAYDAKGKKRKYTKKKRIKVFKRIAKHLGKESFYDKEKDVIFYKL